LGTVGYEVGVSASDSPDGGRLGSRLAGADAEDPAICVLGCRSNSPALARRVYAAREAFAERRASLVVACGGVAWAGKVEADAIAHLLQAGGVPEEAIVRERASRDTHENAVNAAKLLRARRRDVVVVVTCSWHLPRARKLFARAGLRVVDGIGVAPPDAGLLARSYWAAREQVAALKDRFRPRVG
jgi:uncharacterized SAM-binding protein YcdF (DUF218 family)